MIVPCTSIPSTGKISNMFFSVFGCWTNRTDMGAKWSSRIWKKIYIAYKKQYTRCMATMWCQVDLQKEIKRFVRQFLYRLPPRNDEEKNKSGFILCPNPRVNMHLPSTPKSPKWLNFWTGYDVTPDRTVLSRTKPPTEWANLHTVSADPTPTDGNVFKIHVLLCIFRYRRTVPGPQSPAYKEAKLQGSESPNVGRKKKNFKFLNTRMRATCPLYRIS